MVRTATESMVAFTLVSVARRAASSAVTPDGGGGVSYTDERRTGDNSGWAPDSYTETLGSTSRLIDGVENKPGLVGRWLRDESPRASMSMNAA